MPSLLAKLNLSRRTIARDLTLRLVVTITLVFGFAGAVNYFFSVDRDTSALHEKAKEIMDNLASVLVTPMWNLNVEELGKIVDVYRQSGIVLDIKLIDDAGALLVPPRYAGTIDDAYLEMTRIIHHDKTPIGRVTVAFSDSNIIVKQKEIAIYSIAVFTILTITLILATTYLLKRYLNEPFKKLETGLEVISSGNYAHQFESVPQEDVNDVTKKVSWMAGEIAKREAALEDNRRKLEVLNQAILDIFSCSEIDGLIRTALTLAHKVCAVDHGWFLGEQNGAPITEEEQVTIPAPIICVRGHVFEATIREVEPQLAKPDSDVRFSFPIKSRYRTIGCMVLSFDRAPDSSTTSLLKSLMSLVTLATIRQSFIRETAFIAAELQVAEAVQRSMLPDEARMPENALVSWHYEPVLRVGGDWFNVIESRDGESLYVIVGDVTGHGLAQGLVTTAMAGAMQVLEAMIRDVGGAAFSKPSQIVTQLGNVIARIAGKSNLRMTCVAAHLDYRTGQLHMCNAGHTFPILLRHDAAGKTSVESLARSQQLMLGEVNLAGVRPPYGDATYPLAVDDVLLFYTDGLTEAVDREGKPFTRKFQRHFSRTLVRRSVEEICADLLGMFRAHIGDVPCKDDMCVLVVGRKDKRETVVSAA